MRQNNLLLGCIVAIASCLYMTTVVSGPSCTVVCEKANNKSESYCDKYISTSCPFNNCQQRINCLMAAQNVLNKCKEGCNTCTGNCFRVNQTAVLNCGPVLEPSDPNFKKRINCLTDANTAYDNCKTTCSPGG